MRTTVDIPEGLLRRVRARAAMEGSRMKDVVNEALRKLLGPGEEDDAADRGLPGGIEVDRFGRFELPVVRSSQPGQSVVTPDALKNAETEDDEQHHGAVFGR